MKQFEYDDIDEDELVNDTTIDRHSLDEHWENQATIHNKWSKRMRQVERLRNNYETKFRLKKAELFKRGRAGEYDLEGSMTDNALRNWVEDHPEFGKLLKSRNKYTSLVGLMQGILYSLNDRKISLEQETKLLLGGIYSEPNIPKEAKEGTEKQRIKKSQQNLNKKMKRKSKKL